MPADPSPGTTALLRGRQRAAAGLASLLFLAGCGGSSGPESAAQAAGGAVAGATTLSTTGCSPDLLRPHVIAVVGTHANMPRPVLASVDGPTTSPYLDCALSHILEHGGDLTTIGVDGRPAVSPVETFEGLGAMNPDGRTYEMEMRRKSLAGVAPMEAASDGADLHGALDLALRTAQRDPAGTVIIVLDNGLSDRGAVNLAKENWSMADPQEVVESVAVAGKELRAAEGTTVFLSGLGEVAEPQPELDLAQSRNIVEIWTAVVQASGATVEVSEAPWGAFAENTTTFVTGVVEPIENKVTISVVTDGPEPPVVPIPARSLGFASDGAEIQPSDHLAAAFAPLVEAQLEQGGSTLRIVGRTDSSPTEQWASNDELSLARANAVRDYLVDLGADRGRIVTVGEGYQACPEDNGPDGYDPGLGELNRLVIVSLTTDGEEAPTGCTASG